VSNFQQKNGLIYLAFVQNLINKRYWIDQNLKSSLSISDLLQRWRHDTQPMTHCIKTKSCAFFTPVCVHYPECRYAKCFYTVRYYIEFRHAKCIWLFVAILLNVIMLLVVAPLRYFWFNKKWAFYLILSTWMKEVK